MPNQAIARAEKMRKSEVSKGRLVVNVASFFANTVLNVTVLLWLQQYLFKRLPPEEFSIYPVVMSILMILPLLTTMVQESLSRYTAEAYAREDMERVTRITSTLAPICAGVGVFLLMLGLFAFGNVDWLLVVPRGMEWDAGLMLLMVFGIVALTVAGTPFRVGLFIRARFVLYNGIEAVTHVVRITLIFVLLFGVSTRVLWVLVAWAASQLVRHALLLRYSQQLVPALVFKRSSIDWSLTSILVSFGWWSLLIKIAQTIRSSSDVLVLNRFASPMAVNEFYFGSIVQKQVQRLWDPIRSSVAPPLIHMFARGETERLAGAYLRGGRIALWIMLVFAAPLIAFSHEVIALYLGTTEMSRSAVVMVVLMCVLPIETGNIMLRAIVRATAQIREFAIGTFAAQIFNVSLTVALVLKTEWGGIAPAVATLVTCLLFEPLYLLPIGLRATGVSFSRWLRETFLPGLLPGLLALGAMWMYRSFVNIDSWLLLGIGAFLGCVVYGGVLAMAMRPAEWADLRSAAQKIPYLRKRGKS